MPVAVRNFYYPKTNNEDLMNFEILNLSPISKFRKLLGNSQFSPFRTLGSKRKILRTKIYANFLERKKKSLKKRQKD